MSILPKEGDHLLFIGATDEFGMVEGQHYQIIAVNYDVHCYFMVLIYSDSNLMLWLPLTSFDYTL